MSKNTVKIDYLTEDDVIKVNNWYVYLFYS